MKKVFAILIGLVLCGTVAAQEEAVEVVAQPVAVSEAPQMRFAYVDADSVMRAMPSYAEAQQQLQVLRVQYEKEAQYNEQSFQRQFSEFLDGQQQFSEPILLKRQRDLQEALEKGLAFRRECDKLLGAAEQEILAPIQQRIATTIQHIGQERGYVMVLPCRPLYMNPDLCDDITPLIISQLIGE